MMNRQIFSCTYQSLKKLLVQHQPVVVRLNSHQTNAVSDIRADTGTENFQQSKDYYKQKLLQFGVGIKVPIQTLIRYHREAPPQIRNVFSSRSTKEFKTFLSRYPDTFKIVNENVLLVTGCEPTTNTRNNKLERLCDGNCPKSARKTSNQTSIIRSMPGASATQSNIRIISSTRESKFVTNAIMNSAGDGQIVVSLDCEGMGLGADGKLSLIQLGIPCGEVYIFDVLKCPQIIRFGGLKSLLESDRVIKIVHDCRGDSANLFAQFSVMLRCVFDTQAAQTVLQYQEEGMPIYEVKNLSLNQLCEWYNVPSNQRKDDVKRMYKQDPNVWAQRPLDSDMLQYAAEDVLVLINEQLYGTMASAIKPGFKALLSDLCTERILTTILPNEIKLRVTARNVADLRKKLSMKNVTLTDFELKLLESSDLPDDEKEKFYAAHKSSEDLNKPKVLDQENTC